MSSSKPQQTVPGRLEPLPREDPYHYSHLRLPPGDLWVYTYGSLMWDPPFGYVEVVPALLYGYHRTFCIYSNRYRGSAAAPGLVLGLDRGGACKGTAYRVTKRDALSALEALWQREMRRRVYVPRLLPVWRGSCRETALTFLANRRHAGYAGRMELDSATKIIATCRGERGPNVDYLVNTLRHLEALGVRDHHLLRLLEAVRARQKVGND